MTEPIIIDVLNELLAAERSAPSYRLIESIVFVSRAASEDIFVVRRMAEQSQQHAGWLTEVILQLGGSPGLRIADMTSAGLHFLQVCPGVDWAEGCFGSLLLTADVTRRGLRFGIGGRPPRIPKGGISGDVDEARLARLGDTDPVVVKL